MINSTRNFFQMTKKQSENTNNKIKIFISHAWADKKISTFKVIENCLKEDFITWIDVKNIGYGEVINDAIFQAIKNSDIFLVLWSSAADKSESVRFELKTAFELNKIVIPCVIDGHHLETSQYLKGRKYIDFYHDSKGINTASLRLKQLMLNITTSNLNLNGINDIRRKTIEIDRLLEESEHIEFRMKQGSSGNEGGDIYIQDILERGIALISSSDKSAKRREKLILFLHALKEISSTYPNPKDELTKFKLMIEKIDEIDPQKREEMLQTIKNFSISKLRKS